jgi:hypothetical protein
MAGSTSTWMNSLTTTTYESDELHMQCHYAGKGALWDGYAWGIEDSLEKRYMYTRLGDF